MVYFENITNGSICKVLNRYNLVLNTVASHTDIPYSFWGAPEAGRKNNQLYVRADTPLHSILHEASHYVCMSQNQRCLDSYDTGVSVFEENATCFLQILLSDHICGYNRAQHMQDMDNWGYSFRLISANAWFQQDAEDTRQWLQNYNIIDKCCSITWKLRN